MTEETASPPAPRPPLPPQRRPGVLLGIIAAIALVLGLGWALLRPAAAPDAAPRSANANGANASDPNIAYVETAQLTALDVGPADTHTFANQRSAVGHIDFNQDSTVPVFAPYQGRLGRVLVKAGDEVKAGQTLYTLIAPDVGQAQSTLLNTSATLRNANATLQRAKALATDDSIAKKELQQAEADQQSAAAAYAAARQSLRSLGLGEGDIARLERERRVETELPVTSPIPGRVTERVAQAGLLVQPGNAPAPVTVSDMRTLWMVAQVPESELALYRLGQAVDVHVQAWPDQAFLGKVSYIADAVDADTRRLAIRAEVSDPARRLRPQMLADFSIALSAPQATLAAPATAIVRESNGDNIVWVAGTADAQGERFVRRKVRTGRSDGNQTQILEGLQAGERIARRNALFLSNLHATTD